MSPRLAFALDLVRDAGRETLEWFQKPFETEFKADASPVTAADRATETLMRERIAEAFPQDAVLGEEYGGALSGGGCWLIDPIDGTKSFVCGVPLYAVLLSYEVDFEPVLGVAHFPALGETVYAERGQGAYWNGEPCRVSGLDSLGAATIACGSPAGFDRAGKTDAWLEIARRAHAVRTWGDAYGHMLVATGRVEAMIDPVVQAWDVSGLSLIVTEAGGVCTALDGDARPRTSALSANAALHGELLEALRG